VRAGSELRTVSDTALLVAAHRAAESERRRPLFRDPYARTLAGGRGERIAREPWFALQAWPVIVRTVVFDEVILRLAGAAGPVACVLNLAAGLDSRPYRLDLPAGLRWIEADLPAILEYKERLLAAEHPRCRLERVPVDLADAEARRRLLAEAVHQPTLVLTEGLLVYLAPEDVSALALDLAGRPDARWWLLDLAGPAALRWAERRRLGRQLAAANAAYRFAPEEGPDFFRRRGWEPVDVRSSWVEARRLRRLPLALRTLEAATLPGERGRYRDLARLLLLERSPDSG
jgi:methyltransferase (TIGR00027 family)